MMSSCCLAIKYQQAKMSHLIQALFHFNFTTVTFHLYPQKITLQIQPVLPHSHQKHIKYNQLGN